MSFVKQINAKKFTSKKDKRNNWLNNGRINRFLPTEIRTKEHRPERPNSFNKAKRKIWYRCGNAWIKKIHHRWNAVDLDKSRHPWMVNDDVRLRWMYVDRDSSSSAEIFFIYAQEEIPSQRSSYVDDTISIESGYAKAVRERYAIFAGRCYCTSIYHCRLLQNAEQTSASNSKRNSRQITPPPTQSLELIRRYVSMLDAALSR